MILFDKLGLPKPKKTKTGYTTDADAYRSCTRRPGTRSLNTCLSTATRRG